jgi:outer membrane protein assembly factor BamB
LGGYIVQNIALGDMKNKPLLLILLFAIFIQACSATSTIPGAGQSCTQPEHDIVDNSHFKLLWEKSGIYTLPSNANPTIQGLPPRIFIGVQNSNNESAVIAFDIGTGNSLWQEPVTLPVNILASGDTLYVGSYNKLTAHDPETGNLIQAIDFPKVGTINNMYSSGQYLNMSTGNGSWIVYDTKNDDSEISEPLLPYVPFLHENEILYINDAEGFKALDANTRSILWQHQIDDPINSHPLFTSDVIVLSTETRQVYVLNRHNGDLIWSHNFSIISNLATDSAYLYFLTPTGELKVIDIQNGQEIQSLSFLPASFQISTSSTMRSGYNIWVDPNGEILVLSLGDSCQLMTFRLGLP